MPHIAINDNLLGKLKNKNKKKSLKSIVNQEIDAEVKRHKREHFMEWSNLPTKGLGPPTREGHTAIKHHEKMWVFGGYDNSAMVNTVVVLDLKTFIKRVTVVFTIHLVNHI